MFIMSVNINCCLEDPRLFKTHHGAIDAMFEVLDGYAKTNCSYSADNVRKELGSIKRSIVSGIDAVDNHVDGWVEVYATQYGASISFPEAKDYEADYYNNCEISISNMDEIEVEE